MSYPSYVPRWCSDHIHTGRFFFYYYHEAVNNVYHTEHAHRQVSHLPSGR